jgi:hypothetical protein
MGGTEEAPSESLRIRLILVRENYPMVERNIVSAPAYPDRTPNSPKTAKQLNYRAKFPSDSSWVNKRLRRRAAFELIFQRDCRLLSLHFPRIKMGLGDNTMPRRPIVAATMIVAASLIGITQARLPRPIRDYRDRGGAEIAALDVLGAGMPTH